MKYITAGSWNSFHHESEAACEIKHIEVQSSVLLGGAVEKKIDGTQSLQYTVVWSTDIQVCLDKHCK